MPGSWPQPLFPGLTNQNCQITSPADRRYNCIAWAADNTTKKWWPDPMGIGYWPPNVARVETLDAFIRAYSTRGYMTCADGTLEADTEKIALYVDPHGTPTHAALQLQDGRWTSKMGDFEDIEHDTEHDVSGPAYGTPVAYMRRQRDRKSH